MKFSFLAMCISASVLAAEHHIAHEELCVWCAATHKLLESEQLDASGPAGAYLVLHSHYTPLALYTHRTYSGADTTHVNHAPILQRLKCLALDFACGLDSHDGRVCGLAAELCSDSNALEPATTLSLIARANRPTFEERRRSERDTTRCEQNTPTPATSRTQAQESSSTPTPVTSQKCVVSVKNKTGKRRKKRKEIKKDLSHTQSYSSSRNQIFETLFLPGRKTFQFPP